MVMENYLKKDSLYGGMDVKTKYKKWKMYVQM